MACRARRQKAEAAGYKFDRRAAVRWYVSQRCSLCCRSGIVILRHTCTCSCIMLHERFPACVERIIQSEDSDDKLPLALRLSGLLLLGLVNIYSRQLQYLQEDCLTAVQELDKVCKLKATCVLMRAGYLNMSQRRCT